MFWDEFYFMYVYVPICIIVFNIYNYMYKQV